MVIVQKNVLRCQINLSFKQLLELTTNIATATKLSKRLKCTEVSKYFYLINEDKTSSLSSLYFQFQKSSNFQVKYFSQSKITKLSLLTKIFCIRSNVFFFIDIFSFFCYVVKYFNMQHIRFLVRENNYSETKKI